MIRAIMASALLAGLLGCEPNPNLVDEALLRLADTQPGPDLEDNLQLAAAIFFRLDAIVTRDPKGFAGSAVPVLAPPELLAKIVAQPPPHR